MKEILFITPGYQGHSLYTALQQEYAVANAGTVPNLQAAAALLQAANGHLPQAVIMGHDLSPPQQTITFVRRAINSAKYKHIQWVVVLDENVAFLAEDLTGLAEVLVYQQTNVEALARTVEVEKAAQREALFLSVVNVKGGSGKTSLLTNLADALAFRGKKVLVIDGDVADGDISRALGVPETRPTLDKLAGEISAGQDANRIIPRYIHPHQERLHVIPAPGRSDYGQDYLNEATTMAIVGGAVKQGYEVIMVDMPGNMRTTPFTGAIVGWEKTRFYLLYTPGYTFGGQGFKRAAQIVSGLSARTKARIVVLEHDQVAYAQSAIEREWGLPVVGVLPFDPLVEESQRAGLSVREHLGRLSFLPGLLTRLGGQGKYATAVLTLADRIITEEM